jgi:hypothetical protein
MKTTPKLLGLIAVAFAAGAFFTSPVPQAIAAVIATDVQCTGCVGTSDLAGNAVTAAKIKDGEVKTADIGSSAVTSAKIASGGVGNTDIASNAVTGDKIADGTIAYADVSRGLIRVEHRDDCNCGGTGWDPDGTSSFEIIYDDRITINSVVAVTAVGYDIRCTTGVGSIPTASGHAGVMCTQAIPNGMGINYAIFTNPAYG